MSTSRKFLATVLAVLVLAALCNTFSLPRPQSGDNKSLPEDIKNNYFLSYKTPLLDGDNRDGQEPSRVNGPIGPDTVPEPRSSPMQPAPGVQPETKQTAPIPDKNGLSPIVEKYRARFTALDAEYRERFFALGKQAYDEYVVVTAAGGQVSRARIIARYLVLAKQLEREYDRDFQAIAGEMAQELALAGLPEDLVSQAEAAHSARKQELRRLLYEKGREIIDKDAVLKQNLRNL